MFEELVMFKRYKVITDLRCSVSCQLPSAQQRRLVTVWLCLFVFATAATNNFAAPFQSDAQREIETARAALQAGDLGRAEAAAHGALNAKSAPASLKATALNILGIISDQHQKFDEAEKFYRKAIATDPRFVSARNNLGNLYFKTKREREAIAQYQIVLRSDTAHTEANLNLGMIYQAKGQATLALRHLERAKGRAAADPRLIFALADLYFETKQNERAVAVINELLKTGGDDARIHFTAGLMFARRELYAEAANRFHYVAERQPDSYEAMYNYGIALQKLGRLAEAELALASASKLKGDLPDAHFRLALLYSSMGNSRRAIEEFKKTIELDAANAEANFLLGSEYAKTGQAEPAVERYERAVELSPKSIPYLLKLAQTCFKLYRYQRAEDAYRQALASSEPRTPEINYLVGYAARAQGKFPEAVEHFKKELAINPAHIESLAGIGFIQVETGEFAEAEKYLKEAIRLQPNHVNAQYDLGRLYLRQRKYEEAEKTFARVIALKPDHTQAHYQMFLVYSRTSRQQDAARMMEIFKKLEEEDKREREARDRNQGVSKP